MVPAMADGPSAAGEVIGAGSAPYSSGQDLCATSPLYRLTVASLRWDPGSGFINTNAMESADAVVNLNGASIGGGRWNPARKKILRSSRIDVTRVLVDTFTRLKQKPRVFVSASAIGYYGNRGDEVLTESSAGGNDFLADTCRDWEAEALRAQSGGIRTVIPRFGVILSAKGGALTQMLPPFKLGLGGRLGSGQQWMSWIALDDETRPLDLTLHLILFGVSLPGHD